MTRSAVARFGLFVPAAYAASVGRDAPALRASSARDNPASCLALSSSPAVCIVHPIYAVAPTPSVSDQIQSAIQEPWGTSESPETPGRFRSPRMPGGPWPAGRGLSAVRLWRRSHLRACAVAALA